MFNKHRVAVPPNINDILSQAYKENARDLTSADLWNSELGPEWIVRPTGHINPIYQEINNIIYMTPYNTITKKYSAFIIYNNKYWNSILSTCRLEDVISYTYNKKDYFMNRPKTWSRFVTGRERKERKQ